jgi:hypothetical protein
MTFPHKFLRKDYQAMKAKWAEEGFSSPPEKELYGGRHWKEFPVTKGRAIHAWYKRVADFYYRDYSIGETNARPKISYP